MIALLVITDGRRDCIEQTLASARENLHGPITRRVIFDDSADPDHRAWLQAHYPGWQHVNGGRRRGFDGAIRCAWTFLRQQRESYVFHLEDDFTFNRPVDLVYLTYVLRRNPYLAQLALRRQPWNDDERAAGGIVEQHPDDFVEVDDHSGSVWLEHRRFFTTNPSLYRRALMDVDWPEGANSEGRFTHHLLEKGYDGIPGEDVRFGFWGSRDSGEAVEHIGRQRVGTGY
jgi:hypothetical protein